MLQWSGLKGDEEEVVVGPELQISFAFQILGLLFWLIFSQFLKASLALLVQLVHHLLVPTSSV